MIGQSWTAIVFSKFLFIESMLFPRTSVKVLVISISATENLNQNWSASNSHPQRKKQMKEDEKRMSNVVRIVLTAG